ncbi:hypothetical protein HanIR_Chr16g0815551 [Helianthus annuus]|nr:hypothetical protein HanIR_Chr16g0815551 [Helianthus annuus]
MLGIPKVSMSIIDSSIAGDLFQHKTRLNCKTRVTHCKDDHRGSLSSTWKTFRVYNQVFSLQNITTATTISFFC